MSETVLVPGGRDVRGSLDSPEADACVVACPPHPQMGGTRSDRRLTAVADALGGDDGPAVATLRIDYGPWDEGYGEVVDAGNALGWARDRYDRVGLFGYSFGGCIALLAAADASTDGTPPDAVAVLAPAARLAADLDAVAALPDIRAPGYVLYGERDATVDWEPVVERARELGRAARRAANLTTGERRDAVGWTVESMPADHHFVGQTAAVGKRCGEALRTALGY